jgi:hypothetical protein
VPDDWSDRKLWCLLTTTGQLLNRLVQPYQQYPLRLARLVDENLPYELRLDEANQFLRTPECCLDEHYSLPLQRKISSPHELLDPGLIHNALVLTFRSKNINIEVETNFARAANQRSSTRGRSQHTSSAAAKHVVSEIALQHKRAQVAFAASGAIGISNPLAAKGTCVVLSRRS